MRFDCNFYYCYLINNMDNCKKIRYRAIYIISHMQSIASCIWLIYQYNSTDCLIVDARKLQRISRDQELLVVLGVT